MNLISNYLKAAVLASVLLGATGARADFSGAFAPDQWTLEPDLGQTYFANGNSSLDIVGPTGNFSPSYDMVSVTGPAQANPAAQWTLNFNWSFNAGDANGASASIYWPGIPGGNPIVLASGGPGASASGEESVLLDQGDTLALVLDSDETGANKLPAALELTDFSYSAVPDATPGIEAAVLLPLLGGPLWVRLRRSPCRNPR